MTAERTLGIDLASQDRDTAVCLIDWEEPAQVEVTRANVGDGELTYLIEGANKVGIDIPLGWPIAFAEALAAYAAGGPWKLRHSEQSLRLRATDIYMSAHRGRSPLSVSTDKIAIPAMRAARLLTAVDATFDRSGSGKVVEVYPALSLKAWGFDPRRYKGPKGRSERERLVGAFLKATGSLVRVSAEQEAAMVGDDNVFDAFIAALTARASWVDLCERVPAQYAETARVEGWIALPLDGSLCTLGTAPAGQKAAPSSGY